MRPAAIGVRMHSGWGVLVLVSNDGGHVSVIARERIAVINEESAGSGSLTITRRLSRYVRPSSIFRAALRSRTGWHRRQFGRWPNICGSRAIGW